MPGSSEVRDSQLGTAAAIPIVEPHSPGAAQDDEFGGCTMFYLCFTVCYLFMHS